MTQCARRMHSCIHALTKAYGQDNSGRLSAHVTLTLTLTLRRYTGYANMNFVRQSF